MRPIDKLRAELDVYERAGRMTPVTYAYTGWPQFVRLEGREFEARPCPRRLHMRPGYCYGNAIVTAVHEGLAYVEGMAIPSLNFPAVPHAWNLDAEGRVVDTSWAAVERQTPIAGRAYLGIAFSVRRADEATWDGDANVLDDWKRKWPLLRELWIGEESPGDLTGMLELMDARYREATG